MSGPELLEAVGNAERERAAAPDEVPLGEWEAVRVRPDCNAPLISQALLTNAEEAKSLLLVRYLTQCRLQILPLRQICNMTTAL